MTSVEKVRELENKGVHKVYISHLVYEDIKHAVRKCLSSPDLDLNKELSTIQKLYPQYNEDMKVFIQSALRHYEQKTSPAAILHIVETYDEYYDGTGTI